MGWHFNRNTGIGAVDWLLVPGQAIGWAGVDVFFVLSGFLIGGLIFKEFKRTGDFGASRFLIRRAFKIWPVLYLYLILLLIVGRYPWQSFLFQNLFHVQNYFVTPLRHLWSLAVEEQFYLLFAIGFMLLMKRQVKSVKMFEIILPAILVVCPILRFIGARHFQPEQLQFQTQFRIDALAFGISLAYLNLFYEKQFESLAKPKVLLLSVVLLGSVLLGALRTNTYFITTLGYSVSYLTGGALLLLCYHNPLVDNRNALVKAVAWIGVYSYAMYVYQFVMFRIGEAALQRFGVTDIPVTLDVVMKYCGAIGLAYVITKSIERPVLALRERAYPAG